MDKNIKYYLPGKFLRRSVIVIIILGLLSGCKNGNMGPLSEYTVKIIAESDHLWTGVAVSEEERLFVNYPRWSLDVPMPGRHR